MNQEQLQTSPEVAQPLDRKSFWIGVMVVVFAVLLVAHAVRPGSMMSTATAAEAVDGRDYQLVTAAQDDGSEALYVLDKRTGLMAVLLWDPNTRKPQAVDIKPVQAAFGR